jgi:heme exporter protein CcmD
MEQVRTYLAMGGYGIFIWPAFALTAAILIGMLVTTLHRQRALQTALANLQAPETPDTGTPLREARQ